MRSLIQNSFLSLMVLMVLMPSAAFAATSDVTVTVSVPVLLNLMITDNPNNGGNQVTDLKWMLSDPYNKVTPHQILDTHQSSQQTVYAHIWSNVPWKLTIKGSTDYFYYQIPAVQSNKPVGDIRWRDGGTEHTLTTSDVVCWPDWPPGMEPNPDFHKDISFWLYLSIYDKAGIHVYDHVIFTLSQY